MTPEPDSIDPELLALRSELADDPATEARQRVLSRLERTLPALAAATATGLTASGAPAKATLATPAKLWLVGAFALGGAVGAATHAALVTTPVERTVYVDRVVPARTPEPARPEPQPTPTTLAEAPALPNAALPEAPKTKHASPPPGPPLRNEPSKTVTEPESPSELAPSSASLAEQQALLDRARASLGRNDGRAALETLRLHAERFPESVLTEERDALTIKALVRTGAGAEARARLASFELKFPRSPLLPSLRSITRESVTETNRPGQ